jgi:tRNA(fMet)-specific endonuclease VapC
MSLYVLDTDTVSLYQSGHEALERRILTVPLVELAVTVITVEEQLTGWYSALRKAKQPEQMARVYRRLTVSVQFLSGLRILTFSEEAIRRYEELAALKLNVGKMDLRIAAITLEQGGVVVTRNLRDFGRIPGLRAEDWTV